MPSQSSKIIIENKFLTFKKPFVFQPCPPFRRSLTCTCLGRFADQLSLSNLNLGNFFCFHDFPTECLVFCFLLLTQLQEMESIFNLISSVFWILISILREICCVEIGQLFVDLISFLFHSAHLIVCVLLLCFIYLVVIFGLKDCLQMQ